VPGGLCRAAELAGDLAGPIKLASDTDRLAGEVDPFDAGEQQREGEVWA
jgi:hypothetical protein